MTKFSRLLAKQGNVADALLQQHMLSIVGGLVDSAAIAGTGLNGQPKGIVNTVGVAASTGGPDQKSVLTAECNAAINGNDDKFGYITHPIVRFVMRNSGTNLYPFGTDALSAWKSGQRAAASLIGRHSFRTLAQMTPWLPGLGMIVLSPCGAPLFWKSTPTKRTTLRKAFCCSYAH